MLGIQRFSPLHVDIPPLALNSLLTTAEKHGLDGYTKGERSDAVGFLGAYWA